MDRIHYYALSKHLDGEIYPKGTLNTNGRLYAISDESIYYPNGISNHQHDLFDCSDLFP